MANTVDQATFRDLMASFASGVTVVTARSTSGEPRGLTVSACCSVSLDPPLLLVCISKHSRSLDVITDTGRFAVNILGIEQEWLARRFASDVEDKFSGVAVHAGPFALPLFDNALATIICEVVDQYPAGDHVVVIGGVIDGQSVTGQPLVHFRRSYSSVPVPPDHDAPS